MRFARPALAVTSTVLACISAAPAAAALQRQAALEAAVVERVNAVRAQRGLRRVEVSAPLRAAAVEKSAAMVRTGYFGHTPPGGTPFWRAIARRYPTAGYRTWTVGQDLLWTAPELDAATIVRRWLGTPTHRKVLLNASYREVGVGVVRGPGAGSLFAGRAVTLVTLNMGVRTR